MRSLFDTAALARKFVVGFLILTIVIIAWQSIAQLFNHPVTGTSAQFSYYKNADLALGSIPKLSIDPVKIDSSTKSDYSIDRLSNDLVATFPDTAYAYKIEQPREKLTTIEDAVVTAKVLGFTSNCVSEDQSQITDATTDRCTYSGDTYTWRASKGTKTLTFNKTTQQWNLSTDWFNNIDVKTLTSLNANLNTYASAASSLVGSLGFSNSKGAEAGLKSPYVEYEAADLNNAGAFFDPDVSSKGRFVFLEVYRQLKLTEPKTRAEIQQVTSDTKILDNLPSSINGIVYGSDPRQGEVQIIAGKNVTDYTKDVFDLKFTDFEFATRGVTKGLYQIINLREAWSKAQSGGGFLVYLLPENGNPFETYDNLAIKSFIADATKTTLGYYESESWNGVVTPIYVFKGRAVLVDGRQASFTIFVDAIKRLDS